MTVSDDDIVKDRPGHPAGASGVVLDAVLDHVAELVLCCAEDGVIRYASGAMRTVLGFDPGSVVGQNIVEFLHPDEVDDIVEGLARWTGRRGSPQGEVIRVRTNDGSYLPCYYDTVHGAPEQALGPLVATLRPAADADPDASSLHFRLLNDERIVRLASAFLHVPYDDFEKGLALAVEELSTLDWVTRVTVWRVDGTRLVRRAAWDAPHNAPALEAPERVRLDRLDFLSPILEGREVSIARPAGADEAWFAEHPVLAQAGSQAVFAAPLLRSGELLGAVVIETTVDRGSFGTVHLTAVRSAAAILSEAFVRHDTERRLIEEARTDRVTGLGNRWAFDDALEKALNNVSAGSSPGFGMAILDLDRFKLVNDSLGHVVGDRLLADVATRLRGAADSGTVIARLGGDELLLLFPDSPSEAHTVASVRALTDALRVPFDVGGNGMVVTASVGALHQSDARTTPGELLRWADLALYRAKALGGDTIELDVVADRAGQSQRMRRSGELRRALQRDELRVHYQGEWDLETGDLVGAEALVRWEHPDEGLLAAGEFVPLAEATGLVAELGAFVLQEACRAAVPWAAARPDGRFVLRVNVAAHQLRGLTLLDQVSDALYDVGLPPEVLCLELTESTLLADPVGSAALFEQLRALGVGLAIDDFGTGYSSVLQLKQLPITALKIDRAFVTGLPNDPSDRAIVRATIDLARALGISVTAEGVETDAQRTALLELGCVRAQGFLLARPEPADVFARRVVAEG